jgi:hypothetical protein
MNASFIFWDGVEFPMARTLLLFLLYGISIETEVESIGFKSERYRKDSLWNEAYLADCTDMKNLWDWKRDNFLSNL